MNQDTISTLQIARSLLPGLLKTENGFVLEEFLMWPPDLFALTSRILSFTVAYHNVVSPPHNREWPPKNLKCLNSYTTWQIEVRQIGLNWRKNLYEIKNFTDRYNDIRIMKNTNQKNQAINQFAYDTLPKALSEYWYDFTKGISEEDNGNIEDLLCLDKYIGNFESSNTDDNWRGFIALMSLHAIADEACAGWGIRRIPFSDSNKNNLIDLDYQCVGSSEAVQMYAENLLSKFGTLSHINNQRCRILPKRHTPHVGITLRSLSANLAYHRSSVDVKWTSTTGKNNSLINKLSTKPISSHINNYDSISVLLLPWPLHISPLYFQPFYLNGAINSTDIKSFFKFHPDGNELDTGRELEFGWEKLLDKTLENATHFSKVDIVVLPECAISLDNLTLFEKILSRHKVPCYIIVFENEMKPH
ncbi:MAG: hypothetical protein IPL74_04285 [Bacteroidetes bacterium]|nr:hypothetical protein [Bacteroidota bacterium]